MVTGCLTDVFPVDIVKGDGVFSCGEVVDLRVDGVVLDGIGLYFDLCVGSVDA